jgi:hypothetical protein
MKVLITENKVRDFAFLWFDKNKGFYSPKFLRSSMKIGHWDSIGLYLDYLDTKFNGDPQIFIDMLNTKYANKWETRTYYNEDIETNCSIRFKINNFGLEYRESSKSRFELTASVDLELLTMECFEDFVFDPDDASDEFSNHIYELVGWPVEYVDINLIEQ